jgi:signal transduction histidine kinase
VAVNIIQNALDNTYHGRIDVFVSFDRAKEQIIFAVSDKGIGINVND